jgi:hypothetical protein
MPDLAGIRESHSVSLADIAMATKIKIRYLGAIEKGELDKLPGSIYTRSYVRQYARFIDFDEHELLTRCGLAIAEEQGDSGLPPAIEGRLLSVARLVSVMLRFGLNRTTRRTG